MRPILLACVCAIGAPLVAQWSALAPVATPPALRAAPMTHDYTNARTLLLDGPQLWSFAANTWAPVATATQPTGLRGTALECMVFQGTTLLYGGIPPSANPVPCADETWTFDGLDWHLLTPALTPGGLARYATAYDMLRSRVVLYGGTHNVFVTSALSSDTWEFDGTNWSQSTASGPVALEQAAMCFALHLGATLLFGGTGFPQASGQPYADDATWAYDGTTWHQLPVVGVRPAPRIGHRMVYDQNRAVAVMTGGQDPVTFAIFDETWEFDGTQWRLVGPGVAPPRTDAAMVFDLTRGVSMLFGGRTATTEVRDDTFDFAANHRLYGTACLGTFGRPTLEPGARPRLGGTGSIGLVRLDPNAGAAVFSYGFSHSAWAFGSLPASLAPFGMPGCVAYASIDEVLLVPASGGRATWSFAVPSDPLLFDLKVYVQAASFDAARNAAGLVTSNGDILTIGW